MATELILPRVDMDMAEGKIAYWYVKDGDTVTKGQVLFDIETDKATMEVDSPAAGVIAGLNGEIGVPMPVGQVVGWILSPGESLPDAAGTPAAAEARATAEMPTAEPAVAMAAAAAGTAPTSAAPGPTASTWLRATPLARSVARARGVDLRTVQGSGPEGRIVCADLGPAQDTSDGVALHLHWWQRGTGAPIVMLHGFGADHAAWRPLVQRLSPDLPLIGIDLPSHGQSPPASVQGLQDLAAAVLQRLDQAGVQHFHLLGHSMGGGAARALAQAVPQRVRSLTLLAPAGTGREINHAFIDGLVQADSEPALKNVLQWLFHDPRALSNSFVATAFQQLQAAGRQSALKTLAAALMPQGHQSAPLPDDWGPAGLPVKVIWGQTDRILPVAQAAGLPGRVALHVLPNVGHLPQVEAVDLVAELLTQQWHAGEVR